MRAALAAVLLLSATPVLADEPGVDEPGVGEPGVDEPAVTDDRDLQPEDGLPKPDPDDLRVGHWLITARGGAWVPSAGFTPTLPSLGSLDAGGVVGLKLGVGLNRYLVLSVDGGYGRLFGADDTCLGCRADSFDVGTSLAVFIAQGFAFEPWAAYGIGYRRTSLSLEAQPDQTFDAIELARLSIGGTYFPVASFGLGPYLGVDLGLRDFDQPIFYAAFAAGMSVTFDPMRIGTTVRPQVASH